MVPWPQFTVLLAAEMVAILGWTGIAYWRDLHDRVWLSGLLLISGAAFIVYVIGGEFR